MTVAATTVAAMTEQVHGSALAGGGPATTIVVAVGTAAAVGWAAAVPVRSNVQTLPAAPITDTRGTSQQIDAARADLQQVRRDLARLLSEEDDMPRAKLAKLPAVVTQLPSVQLPSPASAPPVVTQVAPAPKPPVTQTTSGASGAHP